MSLVRPPQLVLLPMVLLPRVVLLPLVVLLLVVLLLVLLLGLWALVEMGPAREPLREWPAVLPQKVVAWEQGQMAWQVVVVCRRSQLVLGPHLSCSVCWLDSSTLIRLPLLVPRALGQRQQQVL